MRRSLVLAALLMAACTPGSAATQPAPTGTFSPADAKTLAMICTWQASVRTTSAGLQPLLAQFPVITDHAAFKSALNGLRAASAALTLDPASGDAWMIAIERRDPRPELMDLSKRLNIDSGFLSTLFDDLDAWATKDDLDPTSDLAAHLQQEIAGRQPLMSDEGGVVACPR
jgi:hypothetical protein